MAFKVLWDVLEKNSLVPVMDQYQTSSRERLLRVEINETSRQFLRVENKSESSEEKNSFGTRVLNLQMRV